MNWFSDKKIAVFLHILAWATFILLPLYLILENGGMDMFFIQRIFFRTIIYILIFYINFFLLIPWLLFKGKKLQFYLILVALVVSLYFVNESVNRHVFVNEQQQLNKVFDRAARDMKPPKHPWKFDIYNYLFTTVLVSGFSIGLRMNGRYMENEKKRKELEKEKLSSELALLKNQISPHFFFNTLNNIYSLTEINTKDAQDAILKLSKMMRYLLYESEKEDTMLSSEIDFLKNYIELMKLRLNDKVSLNVALPAKFKDTKFPPLMFISFVENAFKHGVSYREPSFIDIELIVGHEKINFVCKNSLVSKTENDAGSGIGLENIRKRLNLLFPGKHRLYINQSDKAFEVELEIINI